MPKVLLVEDNDMNRDMLSRRLIRNGFEVEPARAGMASGINSTFRQVGIATGVAALGAVVAHFSASTGRGPEAAQGYVDGLNHILLIGAFVAFATSVATFALIRQRDYIMHTQAAPA